MSLSYATATKNLGLDARWDQCDSGFVKLYSGSVPANAQAALSGNTLLAQCTFAVDSFPAASAGSKVANAITSDLDADASGTATFFRATKSDGTVVGQGTVGLSGSGADMILDKVVIVQHGSVGVTGFTVAA